MKKYLLIIGLLLLSCLKSGAQNQNNDSLWQLAQREKNEDKKFDLIVKIGGDVSNGLLDSNLFYAKKLLAFGEKNNDAACRFAGNIFYGYVYLRIGDYSKAQQYAVKASMIAEAIPNNENYMAAVYNLKAPLAQNTGKGISYMQKAIAICKNEYLQISLLGNAASGFLLANQTDSALKYAQKQNELAIKTKITENDFISNVFGQIYLKLNQPDIAYAYFKRGFQSNQLKGKFTSHHVSAYRGMILYFKAIHNNDSILKYQKKFFDFETANAYPSKITASKWMYEYYLKQGNKDSAIKYLLFSSAGNDSLNIIKKLEEFQQARIKEELRQKDLEVVQEEALAERSHNLQLAFIAIGILTAIILFLLLSNSFIISHKLVGFLSVLVLLVVFEFINLLIHPFLEKITHHSPVLMLLGLVAIAAMIIPLHHKLEHWATNKLVEKNKAIRLANAKKTIEELEQPKK